MLSKPLTDFMSPETVLMFLTFSLTRLFFLMVIGGPLKMFFMLLLIMMGVQVKKVNKSKSGMLCHSFSSGARVSIMESSFGISKLSLPFTYLGVPNVTSKY